ncbi:MAG: TlpA disulfide reductase family protein [Archangium sp.]|nr:TlpA disulfide reductase family protein [Archangium sp.]
MSRVLSVALALSVALPASAGGPALLAPGSVAPDFTLERAGGGKLTLSNLRGRVVLVDFWATWCPPCRAELPWLVKLAKKYEAQGVWLVAVNQDRAEEQRALYAGFAPEVPGLSTWAVFGTDTVMQTWQVDGMPTLYLVDRSGKIVAGHEGRLTEEQVTRALEQALRQR